jgi:hypothetical protein
MLQLIGGVLLSLTIGKAVGLLARLFWSGTGVMTESRVDDPVYKRNLQRLIERSSQSEERHP